MKCWKCKWKNATNRVKNGDHLILKQSQCKRTKRWNGVIFSVQCKFVPFIFIIKVFPKTSSQNFHYTSSKRKIVCAGSSGVIIILILLLIIIIIIIIFRGSAVEMLTAYLVFILFSFIVFKQLKETFEF